MTKTTLETTRARLAEAADDAGHNPMTSPTIGDVIHARFGRRRMLQGSLAVTAISATLGPLALAASRPARAATPSFGFAELAAGVDETHHVAPGYKADVLIRWGDPLFADAPDFDPMNQSAAAQQKQFGYNNDFLGYFPIDGSAERGLLGVNHEYTNDELMFPGIAGLVTKEDPLAYASRGIVDIEMAAHGGSVVEVVRENGQWRYVKDSPYNRRLTMSEGHTAMELTGPAAGHDRLKTAADPEGRHVWGMVNNCAGGQTPWGTWLSAEENFHGYFTGALPEGHAEAVNHERYGVPGNSYAWGKFHDRFDISKEPTEPNRYGWIVEIDVYDPTSTPKKRTALGRFKHECATPIVMADGRVAIYSGDDERFDYIYRFVTSGRYDPDNREHNLTLLDDGELSVARFNEDGTMEWLPLVHGHGPLTAENGFASQADVVIEARRAGDLLGATPMDRPEDVEPNPKTGKVYAMLTNNTRRTAEQIDAANPRAENAFGHIVEMSPPDGDHSARQYTWEILVQCGDPAVAEVGATFSSATTKDGWFGMPDNCAFDGEGRLWVSTDGNSDAGTGRSDGLWAMETEGEARGTSKHFFRCPVGGELCGPVFTQDDRSLFVAVQHPSDDTDGWSAFGRLSTFEDPGTRWPDFQAGMPPRPSIVVVTKEDDGIIGS
jgi:secreted PhoX family phosphatase